MVSAFAGSTDTLSHCFLANASHELRTPLNGLIGMLDLLADTALDDNQHRLAATAQRSAEQLLSLIDSLFDLSLLEGGTLQTRPARFNLRDVLEQVVAEQTDFARQHNAELLTHWAVPPLWVQGDPHHLRQLVSATVRTALRQHPYGPVGLALMAAAGEEGNCRLEILLKGTRKPLQRDVDCLSWRFATKLARHMQAHIDIADDMSAAQIRVALTLLAAPDTLAGIRMLFVEARDDERAALLQEFRRHGLRADGFSTAANAVTALKDGAATHDPYRIAIFDQRMQGIDGEMLGRAVMADPVYCDTMLVLRGAITPDDAQRLVDTGFSAAVAAPAAPQATIEALARIVAGGGTAAAPEPPPTAGRGFDGYRVLVADEHVVSQEVAALTLAKLGCTVDVARNASEAAAMQESQPYDLILVDCRLPDLDGRSAAARIRGGGQEQRHPPIIGCTENLMHRDAGVDEIITKPLRTQVLRQVLEKWLPPRDAAMPDSRPQPKFQSQSQASDDLDAARAIFGAGFNDLAALFIADSPMRIASLRASAATSNTAELAKTAHVFSGSTASIGARGLSALCRKLERDARSGILAQADADLAAIEHEYALVETRLAAMLATRKE